MAKLVFLLCLSLLVVSVMSQGEAPPCKPGGVVCQASTECCAPLICNPWAGRCTKQRTTTAAPTTTTAAASAEESGEAGSGGN